MYAQKWNCVASLFPKQNYNVLPPNFLIYVSVSDLYIPRIGLPTLLHLIDRPIQENINRWRIHVCRNWEREASEFHVWEYLNRIFGTVQTTVTATLSKCQACDQYPSSANMGRNFSVLPLPASTLCFSLVKPVFHRFIQDVLPRGIRRLW